MTLSASIRAKLRAHQVAPAERLLGILATAKAALDQSDTGIGKTAHAAAVIATLDLPTLCVVPKISITGWRRMLDLFGTSATVVNYEMLRTGRTPLGRWATPPESSRTNPTLKCLSCQCMVATVRPGPCHAHHAGIHCVQVVKPKHEYGTFTFAPGVKLLVFDEIHRCGGLNSLNADMLIAAKRQKIPTLGLSATPATSPLGFKALGYLFDLHKFTDFYAWSAKYGCKRHPHFQGWLWMAAKEKQRGIMEAIGEQLASRRVRVRTTDVPGFQTRIVQTISIDIESPEKMNAAHEAMRDALKELKDKQLSDKSPDHPLTKILRTRQEIEILKVPATVELAEDFLAKGMSVAVFVNFTQTVEEFCKRLKTKCCIHGGNKGDERTRFIDGFQADTERVLVLNSEAGGISISLHDVRGEFPRVGLIFPGYSATVLSQVLGRLHRDGGRSPAHYRFVFAAKTLDTRIQRAIENKLDNLSALVDADLTPV